LKFISKITRGSESAMNESFQQDETLEFTTSTIQVIKYYPKEGMHRLTPIIFVAFDQPIEHDEVLKTIRFHMESKALGSNYTARLATQNEISQDKVVAVTFFFNQFKI